MPLATPTIWMRDAGDGTGCTVHVTGSDPAATNTIQVRRPGKADWIDLGSRTGNGTVAVTVDADFVVRQSYQARCFSELAADEATSAGIGLTATAAGESVHFRAMCRITERLMALDLPLIGHKVYRQMVEDEKVAEFPCLFVCTPEVERIVQIDQASYQVNYPVTVSLADRNADDYVKPLADWLLWRERCMDELMRARIADPGSGLKMALPGVPEVLRTEFEPKAIIRPDAQAYQYMDSGATVWLMVQYVRKGA